MPHRFRDARDLADDVRRACEDLERRAGVQGVSGECSLAVDVLETETAFEIVVPIRRLDPEA